MSDRIAVFNKGRMLQIGAPEQLYIRPANWFVADFVGESNFFAGRAVDVTDGFCRISHHALQLRARIGAQLRAGEAAIVCARPERIRVSAPEGASAIWVSRTNMS